MKIFYLIAGIILLLIAFVLFTKSLKLGEKKNHGSREIESSAFIRSIIAMAAGLLFIFLYIISTSF